MLLNNGTWFGRLRPVAGPLRGLGLLTNSSAAMFRDNTLQFGGRVSIPNGYQSAYRAVVPTVKETEYLAVRMLGAGDASFAAQGIGSLSVTMPGEGSTVFNGQKGGTLFVTMVGEGSLTAAARGIGSLSVAFDAGARPSAYDIAQEVWQTQAAAVNSTGTTGNKLNSAGSGGVDLTALAAAVWAHASRTLTAAPTGSGLTVQQATELNEIFKLHGLDIAAPLTVTATSRTAGDITQTITDASGTTTVQRT